MTARQFRPLGCTRRRERDIPDTEPIDAHSAKAEFEARLATLREQQAKARTSQRQRFVRPSPPVRVG